MCRTNEENERLWYAVGFTEMAELYDQKALHEGEIECLSDQLTSAENLAEELRETLEAISELDENLAPAIDEYLKAPEQNNFAYLVKKYCKFD